VSKQTFLQGALVLTLASFVNRILGFLYRFFMANLIRDEGMGIFQMVFPVLSLVLTFTTLSVSIAISKLVAEAMVDNDRYTVRRVLWLSGTVVVALSFLGMAGLVLAAPFLANHILHDARTYWTLLALSPIIPVIGIASVYRGYFQGIQNMNPLAISTVLETIVRIFAVWVLAQFLLQRGLEYAVAGAGIGMVLGEAAGLIYLVWNARTVNHSGLATPVDAPRMKRSASAIMRSVAEICVPVTFSRLIGSLAYALEPIIVMRSLMLAGLTRSMATAAFGRYSGMAIPILLLPTIITWSMSTTLVPSVSEAVARKHQITVTRRVAQAIRITAIISFPSIVILTVFGHDLTWLMYHNDQVGDLLVAMLPFGFFIYLQAPLAGILQGLNRAGEAMRNSIIGSALRLVLIYVLASRPDMGIMGVVWAVTIAASVTTCLHYLSIGRLVGWVLPAVDLTKIIGAALMVDAAVLYMKDWTAPLGPVLQIGATTSAAFLLYTVILLYIRVIRLGTIERVPRLGQYLAGMFRFIPFIR
jgi:stage V sporulation protein B